MFGIGGSEWIVIAAVIIALLLVPGALVFGAGFLAGRRAGERRPAPPAEDVSEGERAFQPQQAEPVSEPVGDDAEAQTEPAEPIHAAPAPDSPSHPDGEPNA